MGASPAPSASDKVSEASASDAARVRAPKGRFWREKLISGDRLWIGELGTEVAPGKYELPRQHGYPKGTSSHQAIQEGSGN